MGGGATRERGRPARMHSRSVPLSFPAMRHPGTSVGACGMASKGRGRVRTPSPVEPGGGQMGEAYASVVRAGRPRSRVKGFIP